MQDMSWKRCIYDSLDRLWFIESFATKKIDLFPKKSLKMVKKDDF